MDSRSCFYTISENLTEIFSFSLLNQDRLIVVASAEVELLVFELTWFEAQLLDDGQYDEVQFEDYSFSKMQKKLVGAEYIEEYAAQANVFINYSIN